MRDAFAADPGFANAQVGVQHGKIGAAPRGDAAEFVVEAEERGWMARRHAQGFLQRDPEQSDRPGVGDPFGSGADQQLIENGQRITGLSCSGPDHQR